MITRNMKPRLSRFAKGLLDEWQRLGMPASNASFIVAVSGGADSTALMLAIDESIRASKLKIDVTVAHLDHGLRSVSGDDALFVSQLAAGLGFDCVVARANLKNRTTNLEQAARNARYRFLEKTAKKKRAGFVLTAHTLDDQAETVLLRLLRGSGAEGLGGSRSVRPLAEKSRVQLVRPLLSWCRRADTEDYCRSRRIDYRFDEMNDDESLSRVRVRKQLLPLMKSFNNRIVETLNRTATLLNEDATALADTAVELLARAVNGTAKNSKTQTTSLNVQVLANAPRAVRRRVLREWILRARGNLLRLEMVHLLAVEKLLEGEKGGRIAELPGGMQVVRRRGVLELSSKKMLKKPRATSKIRAR